VIGVTLVKPEGAGKDRASSANKVRPERNLLPSRQGQTRTVRRQREGGRRGATFS